MTYEILTSIFSHLITKREENHKKWVENMDRQQSQNKPLFLFICNIFYS